MLAKTKIASTQTREERLLSSLDEDQLIEMLDKIAKKTLKALFLYGAIPYLLYHFFRSIFQ